MLYIDKEKLCISFLFVFSWPKFAFYYSYCINFKEIDDNNNNNNKNNDDDNNNNNNYNKGKFSLSLHSN